MAGHFSDVAVARNMNVLLQGVKKSENTGDVGLVIVMEVNVKNCGGNHHRRSAKHCQRIKEIKGNKIRDEMSLS